MWENAIGCASPLLSAAWRRRIVYAALRAVATALSALRVPPIVTTLGAVSAAPADRIVSIGGVVIEILCAFGQRERIVTIDAMSLQSPHAAKEKPNVGCFQL
jgi:ABC-type hemin transport system substrate-binding protein